MTRAGRGHNYRVEPRQLWIDLDPRRKRRIFEVVAVGTTYALVETVRLPSGGLVEKEDRIRTRVRLTRFRPSQQCYQLLGRGLK